MSSIRYICLSDLHLGEDNSILTRFPADDRETDPVGSPVLDQLVRCLRSLVPDDTEPELKPVLVLAGDIVDLALAPDNQALMVFRAFVKLLAEGGAPFKQIVYVPGNHDHRIWTTARDSMYAMSLAELGPDERVESFPHSTSAQAEVPAYVLNKLLKPLPDVPPITVAYPNYAVCSRETGGARRCVVFTHGHFVDVAYWLMSYLVGWAYPATDPSHGWPETVEDWEEQNGSWIDFLWSTMGSCGRLGETTEILWDAVHDKKRRDDVVRNISDGLSLQLLASHDHLRRGAGWLGRKVIPKAVDCLAARFPSERGSGNRVLMEEGKDRLWKFVRTPMLKQLGEPAPDELTVILGHTHKPMVICGDPRKTGMNKSVRLYNTGGWVVDGPSASAVYGANLIVVDDQLDAAAIRLYRQGHRELAAGVNWVRLDGEEEPSLVGELKGLLARKEWATFPVTAATEVDDRLGVRR